MKNYLYIIFITLSVSLFTSCSDDDWGNGDPALEHVYFFGFAEWSPKFDNKVAYSVVQGETAAIPVQFHSERVRSYDVNVSYYVTGLNEGVDYIVVDENGKQITKDENGGYNMQWPNAIKGVKNIYIKTLIGSKGALKIQTFNPNSVEPISYTNITIAKTDDYEVRAFTQNYLVTLNIK